MKVSELINQIVGDAEDIFGITDHNNDAVGVHIWCSPDGIWQVSLERPSQPQLDRGEIFVPGTIRLWESNYAMECQADTLMGALYALRERLHNDDLFEIEYFNR